VVIVGDALFAGSMGGAMESYEEALRTNRESLFSLEVLRPEQRDASRAAFSWLLPCDFLDDDG
jgi:hypothetical protein